MEIKILEEFRVDKNIYYTFLYKNDIYSYTTPYKKTNEELAKMMELKNPSIDIVSDVLLNSMYNTYAKNNMEDKLLIVSNTIRKRKIAKI